MSPTDAHQIRKLYHYLDNLDSKRYTLGPRFIEGPVQDLGKRKVFGVSKGGFEAYCVVVFPNAWYFYENEIPLLKENSSLDVYEDLSGFFGMTTEEIYQICIKKNYLKPNLDSCLRRIYSITKAYGFSMNIEKNGHKRQ